MKNKIKQLFSSELTKGSISLLIMINIFNVLNYVFHFVNARLLGPEDYGILAAIMSILYVFTVPSEALQTVASRYTSKFKAKGEFGKIKFFIKHTVLLNIKIAAVLMIVFALLAVFFLSSLINIPIQYLLLTSLLLISLFVTPVIRGVLQGLKKFNALGANMVLESMLKIVFSVAAVIIGIRLYGIIIGLFLAILIAFFIAFFSIKEIRKVKEGEEKGIGVYRYNIDIFLATLAIILMYSLDIIIARAFFDAATAGQYAVASMLGKIIFFAVMPIGKAMFPITSERHEKGEETAKSFRKAMMLTIALCAAAIIAYLLVPNLIIGILYGKAYLSISGILIYQGAAASLLAFANLILLYNISIKKLGNKYLLLIPVALQVALLLMFHGSLQIYSLALLTSNLGALLASILIKKWR